MHDFSNTIKAKIGGKSATVAYKASFYPDLIPYWVSQPLSILVDGKDILATAGEQDYELVCEACAEDLWENVDPT